MRKFTVFRIADEDFGIGIESVVEILKAQKVFSVPNLPDFLLGVINVRGVVIPILDLRRRFGTQPAPQKERIIIVRYDGKKIGLLVDEVREIISLTPEEVLSPPAIFKSFRTEYLTGLGKKKERIIILLNIDRLLTSNEKIILENSNI